MTRRGRRITKEARRLWLGRVMFLAALALLLVTGSTTNKEKR